MAAKIRNRIKQVLYRPIKKRPQMEFVSKRLGDAEKALNATVGGALKVRKKKKRQDDDDENAGRPKAAHILLYHCIGKGNPSPRFCGPARPNMTRLINLNSKHQNAPDIYRDVARMRVSINSETCQRPAISNKANG